MTHVWQSLLAVLAISTFCTITAVRQRGKWEEDDLDEEREIYKQFGLRRVPWEQLKQTNHYKIFDKFSQAAIRGKFHRDFSRFDDEKNHKVRFI